MESIKKYILNQLVDNKLSRDEAKLLLSEAQQARPSNDVAVIGVACRFPGANNKEEYWELLSGEKTSISSYSNSRIQDMKEVLDNTFTRQLYYGQSEEYTEDFGIGGYLDDIAGFDASFFSISPKEAKFMDPYQRVFLETAWTAVEDAGYGGNSLSGTKTGVFVGRDHAEISSYQLVTEADPLHFTGSYSGILASRIAYLFNLQGPCAVLDTACSSGLVAVHTACRSLQTKDCEMAIAAGINLRYSPAKEQGLQMIESKDGFVRTFDKNASGTMLSEGVGAVILKPLSAAVEDGDNIYAIIKGSAINNDGASMGLTAPNAEAQYSLLLDAWNNAGVTPDTISYVEAHGTGTVLGDPIEIEGLTRAFEHFTARKQFCGIGSVKTNIGHTVGASGLAGLIKVILALKHKTMPASLNFNESNPYIDFSGSPFYVLNESKEWLDPSSPRRAGISSFGFSGTNCHVVIEEALEPDTAPSEIDRPDDDMPLHLFTLSAKSKEALKQYASEYIRFLSGSGGNMPQLNRICYTAAVGRGHYSERVAIVVRSALELRTKLMRLVEHEEWGSLALEDIYYGRHKIVPNNKKVLDDNELTERQLNDLSLRMNQAIQVGSRSSVDHYIQLCKGYIEGADMNWRLLYSGSRAARIGMPTYPYQRTRHWAEALPDSYTGFAGKRTGYPLLHQMVVESPEVDIYHSVFNERQDWFLHEHRIFDTSVIPATTYIEMALEAANKYLMGRAVQLSDIYLHKPLIAAHNETINVRTLLLKSGAGYEFKIYSLRDGLESLHAEGKLTAVSKEAGTINIAGLLDRAVWSRSKLEENDIEKRIYFGPRWDSIAQVSHISDQEVIVRMCLPPAYAGESEALTAHPALLDSAINVLSQRFGSVLYLPYSYNKLKIYSKLPAQFYCHTLVPNRDKADAETVSLDIVLVEPNGTIIAEIEGYTLKRVANPTSMIQIAASKDAYHQIEWKEQRSRLDGETRRPIQEALVFLPDGHSLGHELASLLHLRQTSVIKVTPGPVYSRVSDHEYRINISEADDYATLMQQLQHRSITHIAHFLQQPDEGSELSETSLRDQLERGPYSLFYLLKALVACRWKTELTFLIAGKYANRVIGEEREIVPASAALQGFARVVGQENPEWTCRFVDYDEAAAAEDILAELTEDSAYYCSAYREGKKYYPSLRAIAAQTLDEKPAMPLKEHGVYMITGGLGGIGLELANHMASQKQVRLILLSRSDFPDRRQWSSILEADENSRISGKIRALQAIEARGSTVMCMAADVADQAQLEHALRIVQEQYGGLDGVIHAAGVAGYGVISNKSIQQMHETINPKVFGAYLLDKLTQSYDLDFFVMFSSVIALVGGYGQADYAAANSFLDSYAWYRQRMGRRTLSVNWGMWSEVGMAVDYRLDDSELLLKPVTNEAGLRGLANVMRLDTSGVLIGEINSGYSSSIRTQLHIPTPAVGAGRTNTSFAGRIGEQRTKVFGRPNEDYSKAEIVLAQIWGQLLEMKSINVYDNFYELGGDSILSIRLVKMINDHFKSNLHIGDVYSSINIVEMAELLKDYDADSIQIELPDRVEEKIVPIVPAAAETKAVRPSAMTAEQTQDEFVIKQNVIANANHLSWRQFSCYDRSLVYLMSLHNREMAKYYKLVQAMQRAFDLKAVGLDHIHAFHAVQYVSEYFNDAYIGFVGRFGFDIRYTSVDSTASLHSAIQNCIGRKKLVMLPFDEYYLYYSPFYLKKHTDHHIVIYGYDNKKQLYHILNHNHLTRNSKDAIEYGAFFAPYAQVEEMMSGIEPSRRQVINVDPQIMIENGPAIKETVADIALSGERFINRDCQYIEDLLAGRKQWDEESSNELFDYVGAKELLVDTLIRDFGCKGNEFEDISTGFVKNSNLLLKKFVMKMENGASIEDPEGYIDLMNRIHEFSALLWQEMKRALAI